MEIPLMTGGIAHTTADLTAGNKNQKKVAITGYSYFSPFCAWPF